MKVYNFNGNFLPYDQINGSLKKILKLPQLYDQYIHALTQAVQQDVISVLIYTIYHLNLEYFKSLLMSEITN